MTRRNSDDQGSAVVELVVLTPVLLALVMLLTGFGRVVDAHQQVEDAARSAASTAALMSSPNGAAWAANIAAAVSSADAGHQCESPRVVTDTAHFGPGGFVEVSISCSVPLTDLGFFSSTTVSASVTAPIDPYRQLETS